MIQNMHDVIGMSYVSEMVSVFSSGRESSMLRRRCEHWGISATAGSCLDGLIPKKSITFPQPPQKVISLPAFSFTHLAYHKWRAQHSVTQHRIVQWWIRGEKWEGLTVLAYSGQSSIIWCSFFLGSCSLKKTGLKIKKEKGEGIKGKTVNIDVLCQDVPHLIALLNASKSIILTKKAHDGFCIVSRVAVFSNNK